jgi:hypothetical protein
MKILKRSIVFDRGNMVDDGYSIYFDNSIIEFEDSISNKNKGTYISKYKFIISDIDKVYYRKFKWLLSKHLKKQEYHMLYNNTTGEVHIYTFTGRNFDMVKHIYNDLLQSTWLKQRWEPRQFPKKMNILDVLNHK